MLISIFWIFSFSNDFDSNISINDDLDEVPIDYPNFSLENPQNITIICSGQNTIKTAIGTCECKAGYPYGDPNGVNGCWKCLKKCTKNSKCLYPGLCICNDGFKGDGNNFCDPILPRVTKLDPSEGTSGTFINISYFYEFNKSVSTAYCKFGSLLVGAFLVTSKHVVCKAPLKSPQDVLVSISFDAIKWSQENVSFRYIEKNRYYTRIPFLFFIFILCCLIGIIIYGYLSGFFQKETKEDNIPFLSGSKRKNIQSEISSLKHRSHLI